MKRIILINIIILIVFSACTLQEKVSPELYISRLTESADGFAVAGDGLFFEGGKYYCFISGAKEAEYALQLETDSGKNIKKICLAGMKTVKADEFKILAEALIKTYAPNEAAEEIKASLFKNESDYYNSQWYRYSSAVTENGIFFSVENMKISTNSDAELTLKPNDITFP